MYSGEKVNFQLTQTVKGTTEPLALHEYSSRNENSRLFLWEFNTRNFSYRLHEMVYHRFMQILEAAIPAEQDPLLLL